MKFGDRLQRLRKFLHGITVFVLMVLISALIVLYARGYRFNTDSGDIEVTGVLYVETSPSKAQVVLDGTTYGKTPEKRSSLSAGEHQLELLKEGMTPIRLSVPIHKGMSTSLRLQMYSDDPKREKLLTLPQRGNVQALMDYGSKRFFYMSETEIKPKAAPQDGQEKQDDPGRDMRIGQIDISSYNLKPGFWDTEDNPKKLISIYYEKVDNPATQLDKPRFADTGKHHRNLLILHITTTRWSTKKDELAVLNPTAEPSQPRDEYIAIPTDGKHITPVRLPITHTEHPIKLRMTADNNYIYYFTVKDQNKTDTTDTADSQTAEKTDTEQFVSVKLLTLVYINVHDLSSHTEIPITTIKADDEALNRALADGEEIIPSELIAGTKSTVVFSLPYSPEAKILSVNLSNEDIIELETGLRDKPTQLRFYDNDLLVNTDTYLYRYKTGQKELVMLDTSCDICHGLSILLPLGDDILLDNEQGVFIYRTKVPRGEHLHREGIEALPYISEVLHGVEYLDVDNFSIDGDDNILMVDDNSVFAGNLGFPVFYPVYHGSPDITISPLLVDIHAGEIYVLAQDKSGGLEVDLISLR